MDKEKILQELQPIFQDIFDDEELVVTNETNAAQIEDWDSLAQVRRVAAIENEFSIKFTFSQLQELKNVGDMVDLIYQKLQ
ncbi:MAG: acyl carrier protein [Selenomonadaceae bacterium]|nr:acyl carrier protein [Selenomonadaceae bacterium]